MRFRALLAALLATSTLAACSEEPSRLGRLDADRILSRARELYQTAGPRSARPEFERALEIYRAIGDRRGEAIALNDIGNCLNRLGEYGLALDHLLRSLAIKEDLQESTEVAKTLINLGLVYWNLAEYPAAEEHFERALSMSREDGDPKLEGAALNNLGLIADERGDYRHSLELYSEALEIFQRIDFPSGQTDALGNIGGVHLLLGRYREARDYYKQALSISERESLKFEASIDLGNLALCYLGLGEIEESLRALDRALALAREIGAAKEEADWSKARGAALQKVGKYELALKELGTALDSYERAGNQRELVEALSEIGGLHVLLGDSVSGEAHFERAAGLARSIGYSRGEIHNLIALGRLRQTQQRLDEAIPLYEQAYERSLAADDRSGMAASALRLADIHRQRSRFDEALVEARCALATARGVGARPIEAQALATLGNIARQRDKLEEALQQYDQAWPIAEATGRRELGWRIRYRRGQVLEGLGRTPEAVTAYDQAVEIIEGLRLQLSERRFRAGYIDDRYQPYLALIRLLLEIGQTKRAFSFSEKLRARAYLDLLAQGEPPIRDEDQRWAEAELRERIRKLERTLEDENNKPPEQRRPAALDTFARELEAAELAYDQLLPELRRAEPAYAEARALATPPLERLQSSLAGNSALVEYLITEQDLIVFVLTRNELHGMNVPVTPADLQAKVELLRDLLLRRQETDWIGPATSLYRILVKPVREAGWLDGVERLRIVPHGILHYLPFATLVRPNGDGVRFLVEDYVLSYLPSAATLIRSHGTPSNGDDGLLTFAPQPARLPYTAEETEAISLAFPERHLLLSGRRATESAFRKRAERFRFIHFATHGYFNKLNPLLSGLELEADEHHDGQLQVREILSMRLAADLVTLSACQTALGSGYFVEVPPGDDFVGLTRAFLFAGSRAVLASLWEINDRSTATLMGDFYRHLGASSAADALAKAQRAMLGTDADYRHPYYWSAFILTGN